MVTHSIPQCNIDVNRAAHTPITLLKSVGRPSKTLVFLVVVLLVGSLLNTPGQCFYSPLSRVTSLSNFINQNTIQACFPYYCTWKKYADNLEEIYSL